MIPHTFTAFYVDKNYSAAITEVNSSSLPEHEVSIQVHFSSLNYKDALSARGLNRVTKNYPHIPGIDAAGVVVEDRSGTFAPGDKVIVTGNDLGTNTFGGFGAFIRVPASWVVALPKEISLEQSMMIGTAGFTALYGLHRLKIEGINPADGPILVTGATGGVGSFAVFALSAMGYHVEAATRKTDQAHFLKSIGANSVLESDALTAVAKHPLLPRQWQGCIETVGGELLDTVLRQIQPKGAVACCGNVLGIEVRTNILPFILRGISLLGIDSAFCKRTIREQIWETASTLPFQDLPSNYFKIVPLSKLGTEIDLILQGKQMGRVVVEHTL